jgi:predicted CXXCH cytochrome family protein
MRKVLILLVLSLFAASSAFAAGVIGTPHDATTVTSLQDLGTCATCHIPHKAAGGRLWATTMGTTTLGVVSNLCSACHTTNAGYGTVFKNAAGARATVFATAAHDMSTIGEYARGGAIGSSTDNEIPLSQLPYSGSTSPARPRESGQANLIQCTSCHNVHDNAQNRPFLRVNIRDLCIQCHLHRYTSNGTTWAGGSGAAISTWVGFRLTNLGSHPVGTNVSADVTSPGNSPISLWTIAPFDTVTLTLMMPFDLGASAGKDGTYTKGEWNLGLHVADISTADGVPGSGQAGGVVCVSCHAVHGVQIDTELGVLAGTTQVIPTPNLLARIQSQQSLSGVSTANGNGDARNNLCEICHFDTTWTAAEFLMNNGTSYAGTNRPNPGGTQYTHPIDDAVIVNEAVSVFPAAGGSNVWPQGSGGGVGGAGNPKPICESCHVPHPYRNQAIKNRPDVRGPAAANYSDATPGAAFILRDDVGQICADCHNANVANHHPISVLTTEIMGTGTAWSVAFASSFGAGNNMIGNGDSKLECSDCHNMTGAHNWSDANAVGLDPDWEPLNNGRNVAGVGNDAVGGVTANQSKTCEECHYRLRTPGTKTVGTPTHGATEWQSEAEFQKTGTGTHFLGDVNTTSTDTAVRQWTAGGIAGVAPFNPVTTAWTNGAGNAWSRWDGTTGPTGGGLHLVCESCHELEPDKNATGSKLLVYYFQDGVDGGTASAHPGARTGDNGATSYFCEGCHGVNGPASTHAMTGDIVSRTAAALSTSVAAGSFLDAAAPKGQPLNAAGATYGTPAYGYPTFPGANQMSCDSCHQTHDANTASGTFILDAPEAYCVDTGTANGARGGAGHPVGDLDPTKRTVEYTGFCDQCHRYTKTSN